ncbi:hypothetical protein FDP41_009124 [Naegleria fowleri]|uniref:Uncharacterized protein n=1 Tax=Naegleria fowleri TaxID=5763 RepID=A0A6A5BFR9_NAEFO|nr:uncharacterized protein FDP41_009124 [Naegleria fowleri]KAF0972875.1 hypothetical protein FDP41_009124 [Naegleria fowleri]CAG4710315.1 unnamed protein product [Naegleria fowleri]
MITLLQKLKLLNNSHRSFSTLLSSQFYPATKKPTSTTGTNIGNTDFSHIDGYGTSVKNQKEPKKQTYENLPKNKPSSDPYKEQKKLVEQIKKGKDQLELEGREKPEKMTLKTSSSPSRPKKGAPKRKGF